MKYIGKYFRHVFNPLHVYCRLCDFGLRRPTAIRICSAYEQLLFNRF
ncbi:MAG: hypothetical protein JW718_04460 [Desulfovibrionaceae bacterium]|nr:hypothetical protein [Desulfovibrionaceae bacterium]